jgi:hypothetical protein
VLVCRWETWLEDDPERLRTALNVLKPQASRIVLIQQPPTLPVPLPREAIRNGFPLPLREDPLTAKKRQADNTFVMSLAGENVEVIEVDRFFESPDGTIRITDDAGHQLYQDNIHLSGRGADVLKPDLLKAMGH